LKLYLDTHICFRMNKIHYLLSRLSSPQLKMFRDYLHYFSVRKDPDTQLMRLADLLLQSQEEVPSLEDCSRVIYGSMNYNGIQKLKSRLQKKVENLMLMDTGTEKRDTGLDELDKYIIIIRRKVALFHILLLSGTDSSSFLTSEMEDIIRLSKKYELYSILVEQLKYKKWMLGLREGEKVLIEIGKQIAFYQRCDEALAKAVDCYYLAVIRNVHHSKSNQESLQKFLKKNIAFLQGEIKVTGSAMVQYYTKQLEAMYYDGLNKVERAQEAAIEMLKIIQGNKSVYRKQRLAIAYIYLSNCDIRMGIYDQAIAYAISAKKLCARNSVNYYASIDYEFLARLYDGDWTHCQRLSQELLRSVKKEIGDFSFAKYLFYQASVYYMNHKYKEALRLLNYKLQLSKDKQGWDVSIRILKIQTLVDMGMLDEASTQVLGLLKHVERSFFETEMKPREKLILKTLRLLEHEGFSGQRVKTKLEKSLELLRQNENYKWEPLSSELYPFENWLMARFRFLKLQK